MSQLRTDLACALVFLAVLGAMILRLEFGA